MKKPTLKQTTLAVLAALCCIGIVVAGSGQADNSDSKDVKPAAAKQRPVMTVTAVKPQQHDWPLTLTANGAVAPWQEAVIGSELGGQRLAEVLVNVGDTVRKGQVLARFASDSVAADVALQEAAREEARAAMEEAKSNADRARELDNSGAMSAQQRVQYLIAERTAKARLASAEARLRNEQIRLRQTQVVAPDDGVITARSATLGAVAQQGQELFKFIRQNRLEWRAEVPAADLLRVKPGQAVQLAATDGSSVAGKVRMLGPVVDAATRSATVYVDLPDTSKLRPGMFLTGSLELGSKGALTVPHGALQMRDGAAYVFTVGADDRVVQTHVTPGRRVQQRIEVVDGVKSGTYIVDQGAGFLADGDIVKVTPPPVPKAEKTADKAAKTASAASVPHGSPAKVALK